MLSPGSQIVATIFTDPQQFTVTQVDQDCAVHVQSNVQPLSMIIWPTDYRVGVTLTKF